MHKSSWQWLGPINTIDGSEAVAREYIYHPVWIAQVSAINLIDSKLSLSSM